MTKSARHTVNPGPITWLAPLYADAGPIVGRRPRPEPAGPYGWLAALYLPEHESRRHHHRSSDDEGASSDEADSDEQNAWMAEVLGRISA